MSTANVRLEFDGAIAQITLDRAQKLNALTPEMMVRLSEIADEIDRNRDVRVAILTASGQRVFCAGADINAWSALEPLDMWRRWLRDGHAVFDRLARLRQPLIAALEGASLGGGLELAITADIRIAADNARFGLPEASIGTVPGWSGTQRLTGLIGPSQVKRLVFSGDPIDAEQALKIGLINEISASGCALDSAKKLAARIAERAPVSVQVSKQLIDAAHGEGTAVALESLAGALAAMTQDGREGAASFREKRPAQYKGE